MSGIYIHIPFCKSRCIYCGFYSTVDTSAIHLSYANAVVQELQLRKHYLHEAPIRTVYLGGGTPSVLSREALQLIISAVNDYAGDSVEEFTVECNPDDVAPDYAVFLASLGVNRVSMGVQTFSDERLRFLNRRHTASQIPQAVTALRKAGIKNISIDLMFGFPGETVQQWRDDITTALALDVEHLSAYSLMYEEGTPLYTKLEKGEIEELPEGTSAEMYETLLNLTHDAGYEHYEISNFAKPHYRSRHNSCYWDGTTYIGLGAAAHSYDGDSRQWNVSSVREYISSINEGKVSFEREELDDDTKYNDLITTALRTRDGIDLTTLPEHYRSYLLDNAQKSLNNGLLTLTDNRIHLTRQGLYISDSVMEELIMI